MNYILDFFESLLIISISAALLERALSELEAELRHVSFIFLRLADLLEAASQFLHLEAEYKVLVPGTVAEIIIVFFYLSLYSDQDRFNRALIERELRQYIFPLLISGCGTL